MSDLPHEIWVCAGCLYSFVRFEAGDSDIAICDCPDDIDSDCRIYAPTERRGQQ